MGTLNSLKAIDISGLWKDHFCEFWSDISLLYQCSEGLLRGLQEQSFQKCDHFKLVFSLFALFIYLVYAPIVFPVEQHD